jgi:hypothetical protein
MGGQIGGSLESTITVLAFMFLEQNDGHVYELTASTSVEMIFMPTVTLIFPVFLAFKKLIIYSSL